MNDLGDHFKAQAPNPPDAAGWAEQARGRYQRRRTVSGTITMVLVVALGLPVGWMLTRDLATTPETVVPAAFHSSVPDRAGLCAPYQDLKRADDATLWPKTKALPEGPARVWLCDDRQMPNPARMMPRVPLTDPAAVQKAIGAYNALPADNSQVCTSEFGTTYYVVYEYPDGTRVPVRGALYGCRSVSTGPDSDAHRKAGSGSFLDGLLALWPKDSVPAAGCPTATKEAVDRASLIRVVVCLPAGDQKTDVMALTQDALEAVRTLEPTPIEPHFGTPILRIALVDKDENVALWDFDGQWLRDAQGHLVSSPKALTEELQQAITLLKR